MPELPQGDDLGAPDARLAAALALDGRDSSTRALVLAALVDARVFAAITATSTAEELSERTGLRAESSADMAVLLVEASDGSRALPVFPGLEALAAWRSDARPVALTGVQACTAAVDEHAVAVLLDPAGAAFVVEADELAALADGWVPVPGSGLTARRTEVRLGPPTSPVGEALLAALLVALAPEGLAAARLLEGPEGLVLGVAARQPLADDELAALASRVVRALGAALPPAGLDLLEVPVDGPGLPLRGARKGWFRRRGR